MVKRIWALVLCAVLLLSILPVGALAANDNEMLIEKTRKSYESGLEATGQESFHGLCGTMVAHQLKYFGVSIYPEAWDGNKQYDNYAGKNITSGGYYVDAYPATEYSLEQALDALTANGTRDVYNILVGFETTNTEAGALFGHACVITAIVDGTVYFAESFDTSFGVEGTVIRCTIKEFAAFYSDWAVFEGLVCFSKDYASSCHRYGTDIFVRTRFSMALRSQPRLVGQENCRVLRTLAAGERLRVTAVLKDLYGTLYYQVQDGDRIGYIVGQTASLDRVNVEELSLTEDNIPVMLPPNRGLQLSGTVQAANGLVGAVELVLSNEAGEVICRERKILDRAACQLSSFNDKLQALRLKKGRYTLSVYADTASAYVLEDALDYTYGTLLLTQKTLWVGMEPQTEPVAAKTRQEDLEKSGWYWENGTWFCYDGGKPRTGWFRSLGVEYYLQEDGSVTTGWAEIDGQLRCFSATGALCTGWLETEEGMRYAFSDGSFAEGWQTIGVARYYFDEGLMQTKGSRMDGDQKYQFRNDGRAVAAK